ncbi:TetR/AcrR family transcriptional regulator [Salipaludibacillus aurantiacus]|uniref:Regulatory protein, tetR family n=1 Tax=Salipaludibacillus aurantiacus TaxID=1601833 RepID=A0A1H9TRT6_9BACI|nr:helix-turn-helix domain-containing protein [Salipaludibacillus aurantiacus]SER99852.1 regulatory protein, tetR family [Salipaludibacillus aurantiacus]
MRDKTDQIKNAAIKVFINKGFQATTQELANEAEVAEMTLFRKFGTKEGLFKASVKSAVEQQDLLKWKEEAEIKDTEEFLRVLIDNRLNLISQNRSLVRMLLAERLMGNLPEEIDLPEMIFCSLEKAVKDHAKLNNLHIDTANWERQLSGIFLSYLCLPSDEDYYALSEEEKEHLLSDYVASFKLK